MPVNFYVPSVLAPPVPRSAPPAHLRRALRYDLPTPLAAVTVKNSLKTLDWEVLPHPPHSPDIAPAD
ncbi:hypothetical protein EVAR_33506_1 [Eumeta japonica]|uniref:Mariner Mos1 transposase n=1 Tax=Eumeta variegata TaxID=151549 RepID=A0A4C1VI39_EUMVA|nr:hypothetical protein EVAR_33506_1 [Eumeta japonica]